MATIIDSRYGEGWVYINLDFKELTEDDYFSGFNSPDYTEHSKFMEKEHMFPMGLGGTPDQAELDFILELSRFINHNVLNYRLKLV